MSLLDDERFDDQISARDHRIWLSWFELNAETRPKNYCLEELKDIFVCIEVVINKPNADRQLIITSKLHCAEKLLAE